MMKPRTWLLLLLVLILCLLSLTGCSPARQIVRTEYVHAAVPDVPAEPAYWPVLWQRSGDGSWALDEGNAKNLLKNVELMKSYQTDMRIILENLQGRR